MHSVLSVGILPLSSRWIPFLINNKKWKMNSIKATSVSIIKKRKWNKPPNS